jgi:hypothetical protein
MTIKVFYSPALNNYGSTRIPTEKKAGEFVRALGWEPDVVYHGLVRAYPYFTQTTIDYALSLLSKVHSPAYLEDARPGWGRRNNALAHNIILFKACEYAAANGIAFAPVSGFHHASYDSAWGFCTFNGLVAAALQKQGRVLILDGDQHFGDGTDNIITRLKLRDKITNYSIKEWDDIPSFEGYDHIIYQAGADAHYLDGGYLTDSTWVKRDELVFTKAKAHNVPITVTFAGGYSSLQKVVDLHLSTYWTASRIYYGGGIEGCRSGEEFVGELSGAIAKARLGEPGNVSAWARLALFGEAPGTYGAGQWPRFYRYNEPWVYAPADAQK